MRRPGGRQRPYPTAKARGLRALTTRSPMRYARRTKTTRADGREAGSGKREERRGYGDAALRAGAGAGTSGPGCRRMVADTRPSRPARVVAAVAAPEAPAEKAAAAPTEPPAPVSARAVPHYRLVGTRDPVPTGSPLAQSLMTQAGCVIVHLACILGSRQRTRACYELALESGFHGPRRQQSGNALGLIHSGFS